MVEQNKKSNIWVNIGAILFGIFLSSFVVDAIRAGATRIFTEEAGLYWAIGFWGERFILRILVSVIGTAFGGFAAGIIAKTKGRMCGLLSAVPTSLFWLAVVITLFIAPPESASFGHWGVSLFLIIISPCAGFYTGIIGHSFRKDYPEIFEFRPRTILGIKWFHWLWLIFPLYLVIQTITIRTFQALGLFFGSTQIINTSHGVLPFFVSVVIITFIYFIGYGLHKTFYFLSTGYKLGLSKFKITSRVLFYLLGIPLLSDAFIYLLSKFFQ